YYAYRAVYLVDGGPDLTRRQMRAAVITGFGGFFARGGGALDKYALEAAGADERDAKVRVSSLAGMEHGVLALVGEAAAIAVLIAGYKSPPADFSVPWAVIPLPGFLVAFWAANRYRDRFRGRGGWGAKLGVFLDSIYLIRDLFVQPRRYWRPLLGMAGFWLSEIFAGWAGLHAFGFGMNGATFIVGFGTGMVFTRRTGPLAGAGILALVLAVTVWYSGAPFGAAVAGIFAYRFLSLWLPMPVALATLPVLREMGHERVPGAEQKGEGLGEPALEERASA
ncbi:MAG: hypothetical protein ACRDZX_05275, partial [Acidimicrobiales bacterium]